MYTGSTLDVELDLLQNQNLIKFILGDFSIFDHTKNKNKLTS